MAGRKRLTLSQNDINELYNHIQNLTFKREMHKQFLNIFNDYIENINFDNILEKNIKLINKCRYERNVHEKRMNRLQLIKSTDHKTLKALELNILELHQRSDIDAYFSMHDALDELLKIQRNKTSNQQLQQRVKKVLNNEISETQRTKKEQDRMKYYIGSLYLNLLKKASYNLSTPNLPLTLMNKLFHHAYMSSHDPEDPKSLWLTHDQIVEIEELIEEAKQDQRNPFNKKMT